MNPKNNEIVINIKDLVIFLLKKIVPMIIVGAVLGGSLGSYRMLQRMKTNDVLDASTKLNNSETDIQYELRVQNINKARVYAEMINNLNKKIDQQKDYLANSIYMQIDPENVYQSTAQIALTLENNDINGIDEALFGAYSREISAGNYLDDYALKIGKKTDYIKELISFSSTVSGNTIISVDNGTNRMGSMYISVVGPSREFCDEVMELVINEVQSVYDELNSSVARHELLVVGIQKIQKIDNNIRDRQIDYFGVVNSLQNQISQYNDSLDLVAKDLNLKDKEDILSYFAEHPEVVVDGIPVNTSEKVESRWGNLKSGIKWGVLGFFVGFFVVASLFAFCYFFSKVLLTQAQFKCVFDQIYVIGVLRPIGKRSKVFKILDIKSEDDTKLSDDNLRKLIAANYKNLTRSYNKILITGTGDSAVSSSIVKSLDLNGDFMPDLFSNPEVLTVVPDYDAVVLLEQRNYSVFKNIKKEITLISNGGTPIVGAIII